MLNVLPLPNDIILRRSSSEPVPVIWLREQYLIQLVPGISAHYLRVKARAEYKKTVSPSMRKREFLPDTMASWRWGKKDGQYYYSIDNIPDKKPAMYKSQLPTKKELMAAMQEANQETTKSPLHKFITDYEQENIHDFLPYYGCHTETQMEALAKACCFLSASAEYVRKTGAPTNKSALFLQLEKIAEEGDYKYIPTHFINIRKKVLEIINGTKVTELIKLHRAGNNNAATHSVDAEIESWVYHMITKRNYTNAHVIRKVQYACTVTGKPMPSDKWLNDLISDYETRYNTSLLRYGSTDRFANKFRPYTPYKNSVHAGDCWQVDGTRVNFINFKHKGKDVFLYIIVVRDIHSGDVLGYSFDISENRWVVHNALRMAVEETGYLPWQLMCDKFPGHNTPEMTSLFNDLRKRGVKVEFTHKATGKPQIERHFSTMQQVFMQESDYYYGEGIKSRNRFAHRSKEQLAQMRKAAKADGWDFDKAIEECERIIDAYRNTPYSHYSRKNKHLQLSPAQLHTQSEKPNVKLLEPHQAMYLFGFKTKVSFRGEGLLKITINHYDFHYRCTDPEVLRKHERVTVCYDVEDLGYVHIYEISENSLQKYLATCREVDIQGYGPDTQWGRVEKQKAIIAELTQEKERQLSMKMAAGSEFTMLLTGTVSKAEAEQAETQYLNNDFGNMDDDESLLDNYYTDQL